jgi:hypothetical protein
MLLTLDTKVDDINWSWKQGPCKHGILTPSTRHHSDSPSLASNKPYVCHAAADCLHLWYASKILRLTLASDIVTAPLDLQAPWGRTAVIASSCRGVDAGETLEETHASRVTRAFQVNMPVRVARRSFASSARSGVNRYARSASLSAGTRDTDASNVCACPPTTASLCRLHAEP